MVNAVALEPVWATVKVAVPAFSLTDTSLMVIMGPKVAVNRTLSM